MTIDINDNDNIVGCTFNAVSGNQTNNFHFSQSATSSPSSSSRPMSCPRFNDAPVDLLSVNFTGRDQEIALIIQVLETGRGDVPSRCALYGMHGVGKSQVSYELAKALYDQGKYTNVFYMQATTIEKLYQGFSRLLHLVSHPDRFAPEQDARLTATRRWLEDFDAGRWLLVLDNATHETVEFLRDHLPRKNCRGNILFTTRTENVARALTQVAGEQHGFVELHIPDIEDAARLLLRYLNGREVNIDASKVRELVKGVGCLPLAVAQAALYMVETGITLDDMVTLFDSKHKIDLINWENSLLNYHERSVAATFVRQLRDLERQYPEAGNLLKILVYLDPECIPLDVLITGTLAIAQLQITSTTIPTSSTKIQSFMHGIKQTLRGKGKGKIHSGEPPWTRIVSSNMTSILDLIQSPTNLQHAITQLQDRSLIMRRQDAGYSSLYIHDLIQLVVLELTKESGGEREWFEYAVELTCQAFRQIEDPTLPASWPQCEILIPHIQSLMLREGVSDMAKMSLFLARRRVAKYFESCGRNDDAEELYKQLMEQSIQAFGPKHDHTLEIMHELAMSYELQGRHDKADELYHRVMLAREKQRVRISLTMRHQQLETLSAMHNLAMVYESQGRHNDAEKLFFRVLQGRERQLGTKDVKTLATMHNLALVYRSQGRYTDAERLFDGALKGQRAQFGSDHITTLRTTYNLALLYKLQTRHSDAGCLLEHILRIQEKQIGLEHVTTLRTMHDLALVYELCCRYDDAKKLLERILEIQKKQLGSQHASTLRTTQNLARVYHEGRT